MNLYDAISKSTLKEEMPTLAKATVEAPPKPSAKPSQTETPAFKAWFGDSKVVDKDGKPLRVYHGTTKKFDAFSLAKGGKNTQDATARLGIFFAVLPSSAAIFAQKNLSGYQKKGEKPNDELLPGANLIPVYLKITNPVEVGFFQFAKQMMALRAVSKKKANEAVAAFVERMKKDGFDGIIIKGGWKKNSFIGGPEFEEDNYVIFDPAQAKSAIGNKGTFDPKSPKIAEDVLKGGKSDTTTEDFDTWLASEEGQSELSRGIQVEMEHTDCRKVARKIATDHLVEDRMYYRKLKKAGLADELKEAVSMGVGGTGVPSPENEPGNAMPKGIARRKKRARVLGKDVLRLGSPANANMVGTNPMVPGRSAFAKGI